MRAKFLFLILFLSTCIYTHAQDVDSIFVMPKNAGWVILHTVNTGETVFMLARRYHVPPAQLADANGLTYQSGLATNSTVFIPIAAYNQIKTEPAQMNDARALYYRVSDDDNLYRISKRTGVQQQLLQQWNGLPDNTVIPGQTLLIGWVLYDATPMGQVSSSKIVVNNNPVSPAARPATAVTPPPPPVTKVVTEEIINKTEEQTTDSTTKEPGTLEVQYMQQTSNEQNIATDKGPAVFFDMASKINDMYFAFHNTVAKGNIIKVTNPGTGKTIYAKVLGPIPNIKQYYNCIIGISSNAKEALGATDKRAFCELSYAGN